jgi:hypothetical protein
MRGTMSAGMMLETRGGGCCREDLCRTRRLMERGDRTHECTAPAHNPPRKPREGFPLSTRSEPPEVRTSVVWVGEGLTPRCINRVGIWVGGELA